MLCGIDEAGRGCLAGPLAVAGCVLHHPMEGLADSKELSEVKREALFEPIKANSHFHVALVCSTTIDEIGISGALQKAIHEIMANVKADAFLIDGNTHFGILGLNNKIKADQTVSEVSAASILAKVTRDRLMKKFATRFPVYGFDSHKGYGSKSHIEAIRKHGLCEIHRRSYKIKALEGMV